MTKIYTLKDIEEASKLYESGLSLAQCEATLGIDRSTIQYFFKRHNIPLRSSAKHYNRTNPSAKVCPRCHIEKPVSEFHSVRNAQSGRPIYGYCKPCQAEAQRESARRLRLENPDYRFIIRLKNRYSLSWEDYCEMVKAQEGKCYICRKKPKERLYVDHDHVTGKIRKLLCRHCNLALGYTGEDRIVLQRLIAYIEEHNIK